MIHPPSREIRIGLCGLGTVGQGVWRHVERARTLLENRLGARLTIARVAVRDPARLREVDVPASIVTADAVDVARDPSIDIVCELIGGCGVAREVAYAALERGATLVTGNKKLLSEDGPGVLGAARRNGGHVFFEASVAGGIPIIKALREGLVANRFPLICGILNGTCNYLLTRMEREGRPLPELIADAQRLGYAEADASLDVDGWDTAHKAAVLAWLAHGVWVPVGSMHVEGIGRITVGDIRRAAELGHVVKLLATIERDFPSNELSVRVQPTLVPRRHVLAGVDGVFNGICVRGDVAGETTYIGRGAGRDATASAVISDLVDAASLLLRGPAAGAPAPESAAPSAPERAPSPAPPQRVTGRHYLRLTVADAPGVLAQVAGVLASSGISIASVLQQAGDEPSAAALYLTTHRSNEHAAAAAVRGLAALPSVLGPPLLLRIAELPD
jgi:homoserine dehydrogenase